MACETHIDCTNKDLSAEDLFKKLIQIDSNGCAALKILNVNPAFNPSDIAGLKSWYNMDAGNITKDGSNKISQINDLSGNGFHLTQATGANQPLWVDAVLNGKPVSRYDGVNDKILNAGFILAQPYTLFAVTKSNITSVGIVGSVSGVEVGVRANANIYFFAGTNVLGNSVAASSFSISSSLGNGALSEFYVNGALNDSGDAGNLGFTNFTLAGIDGNLDGDIAEVILYNSILSNSNRILVQDYLNAKYAVY